MRVKVFLVLSAIVIILVMITPALLNMRNEPPAEPQLTVDSAVEPAPQKAPPTADKGDMDKLVADTLAKTLVPPDYNAGLDALSYTPIEAETLGKLVEQIPLIQSDLPTEEQRSKLLHQLEENLWAYKTGSSALILADRYSAPHVFNTEHLEQFRALLKNRTDVPESQWPADLEGILPLIADRMNFKSDGLGYANLYNAISPEGSTIRFHRAAEIPIPLYQELSEAAQLGGPRVYKTNTPLSSITYMDSPAKILDAGQTLLLADVRLAATDADNEYYYRIKRYYWSAENEQWLAMDVTSIDKPTRRVTLEFF